MLRRALLLTIGAVVLTAPVAAAQTGPSCATFDARNQSTTAFRGGDVIIVRGAAFAARTRVLVTFQQGTRSAELGRVRSSDLGAFSTPADTRLPASVTKGAAQIRALDGSAVATCAITLTGNATGAKDDEQPIVLFVVWGAVLAVIAVLLITVSVRRAQASHLQRAMSDLHEPFVDRRTPEEPLPVASARTGLFDRGGKTAPPRTPPRTPEVTDERPELPDLEEPRRRTGWGRPVLEDEDDADDLDDSDGSDDDEPFFDEVDEDEFASDDAEGDLVERDTAELPEPPPPGHRKPPRESLTEPPRLPPDWDPGAIRPRRGSSDTVSRLREQAKDWDRR